MGGTFKPSFSKESFFSIHGQFVGSVSIVILTCSNS